MSGGGDIILLLIAIFAMYYLLSNISCSNINEGFQGSCTNDNDCTDQINGKCIIPKEGTCNYPKLPKFSSNCAKECSNVTDFNKPDCIDCCFCNNYPDSCCSKIPLLGNVCVPNPSNISNDEWTDPATTSICKGRK